MTTRKQPEIDGSASAASGSGADAELDGRRARLGEVLAQKDNSDRQDRLADDRRRKEAGGMAQAIKLSSEFIAGILAGAAIGWVIDKLLGTSPLGLIIFLLLGFCAGVLNILHTSGLIDVPKSATTRWAARKPGRTG